MSDIATSWSVPFGRGDWSLSGGQLAGGQDLTTAILISLFTDRMANPDDAILDGSGDPRGWWGDLGESVAIGSRLWLLERAKQIQETLNRAVDYAREALQWLIDDGVVAKFDIAAEWTRPGMLGMQVVARRRDGSTIAMKFPSVWQGLA